MYSLKEIKTAWLYTTNMYGIKAALKSCLAALIILHHGLATMAISALNTLIQWHVNTANQSIHPVPLPAVYSCLCITLSTKTTIIFSDLFHQITIPTAKRQKKRLEILIHLGNHSLHLILFWCTCFTPIRHFHTKHLLSNKMIFLLLFLEKLHMHCFCVDRGRWLLYCNIKYMHKNTSFSRRLFFIFQ